MTLRTGFVIPARFVGKMGSIVRWQAHSYEA